MTREETFKASGPTSGAHVWVKIGVTKDGTHHRRRGGAEIPGRRLPGRPGAARCDGRVRALRHRERQGGRLRRGHQPAQGRGLSRARRADLGIRGRIAWSTRSPRSSRSTRSSFRLKNAAKEGTHAAYGPNFGPIGLIATLEAAKAHPHWSAPLGPNQGRGIASGFWFNIGGETSVTHQHQRGRHGDAWSRARPTSAARAPRSA